MTKPELHTEALKRYPIGTKTTCVYEIGEYVYTIGNLDEIDNHLNVWFKSDHGPVCVYTPELGWSQKPSAHAGRNSKAKPGFDIEFEF